MNQIKFRLLNENNKIVGYEKWNTGHFNMEHKKDYYVDKPKWLYSKDNEKYDLEFISHRYKNQFTVQLDKKGVEIYEGDIVSYEETQHWEEGGNTLFIYGEVKWCSKQSAFIVDWKNDDSDMLSDFNVSIMGNIYSNPELLEPK